MKNLFLNSVAALVLAVGLSLEPDPQPQKSDEPEHGMIYSIQLEDRQLRDIAMYVICGDAGRLARYELWCC